ncbi:MAG: HEAT repeat domain-containing protein [Planctomycetota bacterium]
MDQGDVEVLFCDLCGSSVPLGDVPSGLAVRHHGSTVGKCCLPALRQSGPAAASPAAVTAPRAVAGEGRSTLLGVVVVAAAALTMLFLDRQLQRLDQAQTVRLDALRDAQKSDSQVLGGVAVALDGVARRSDLDAIAAAVANGAGETAAVRVEVAKRLDELAAAIAAAAQQARAGVVDYAPLFEDLRQRQLRILDRLAAAPAAAPAAVPTPTPEPVAPAASHDAPVLGLPAALAEAARKLAAGDPAVRFEGVDELQRSKDAAAVPLLLPLLRDPDPFVRRLVAEGFAAHKRADVVEGLLAALGDADEYVRDTAWRSLKDVTGQKLPFESAGTKDARARATARWQEWWDKNKAGFGA